MKRYIIRLKIVEPDFPSKTKKDVIEEVVKKLIDKTKLGLIKILDKHIKSKDVVHIKNDTPLPIINLDLNEDKAQDLIWNVLRHIPEVDIIEVDYEYNNR